MFTDLFNIGDFIKLNELEEVSNPVFLTVERTPTKDGILSYEIFGLPGTRERSEVFAYIDLGVNVLHPLLYKQLTQMDRKIKHIIESTKFFFIDKAGRLIKVEKEAPEGVEVGTGLEWFYKNFDKIKFESHDDDTELRKKKLA